MKVCAQLECTVQTGQQTQTHRNVIHSGIEDLAQVSSCLSSPRCLLTSSCALQSALGFAVVCQWFCSGFAVVLQWFCSGFAVVLPADQSQVAKMPKPLPHSQNVCTQNT